MKCKSVKRNLNRYIDKELPDKKNAVLIEEHIKNCRLCRTELNSLIAVKKILFQKEKIKVKDDFIIRLKKKLEKTPRITQAQRIIETGNLAGRLIPVPLTIMLIVIILTVGRYGKFNPVDDYILSGLNNKEIAILKGCPDYPDIFTKTTSYLQEGRGENHK